MLPTLHTHLIGAFQGLLHVARVRTLAWTNPATSGQALGTLADLARSKPELVAENALLRQQLIARRRPLHRGFAPCSV
jgi:hypothetical protein